MNFTKEKTKQARLDSANSAIGNRGSVELAEVKRPLNVSTLDRRHRDHRFIRGTHTRIRRLPMQKRRWLFGKERKTVSRKCLQKMSGFHSWSNECLYTVVCLHCRESTVGSTERDSHWETPSHTGTFRERSAQWLLVCVSAGTTCSGRTEQQNFAAIHPKQSRGGLYPVRKLAVAKKKVVWLFRHEIRGSVAKSESSFNL